MTTVTIEFPDDESAAQFLRSALQDEESLLMTIDEDFYFMWVPVVDVAASIIRFEPRPEPEEGDDK